MARDLTHSKQFWAACGKNRYPDKKAAQTELNRLKNERGRHGRPEWLRTYPCPDCLGWHITKGIPSEAKRAFAKRWKNPKLRLRE